jgi:hypothetical protein
LKKMKTKKVFDAVKMMREIREKHHSEYVINPALREKRLAIIRKRYFHRIKSSEFVSH